MNVRNSFYVVDYVQKVFDMPWTDSFSAMWAGGEGQKNLIGSLALQSLMQRYITGNHSTEVPD
jgi:hypothetical protein